MAKPVCVGLTAFPVQEVKIDMLKGRGKLFRTSAQSSDGGFGCRVLRATEMMVFVAWDRSKPVEIRGTHVKSFQRMNYDEAYEE